MLEDLKEDYYIEMEKLSKKYEENKIIPYRIPVLVEAFDEMESNEIFCKLDEDLKEKIIEYITDYYFGCEDISLYKICEGFNKLLKDDFNNLQNVLDYKIDIQNYMNF